MTRRRRMSIRGLGLGGLFLFYAWIFFQIITGF